MPLDPSISLQTKGVDPTNLISGFLDLGLKKTALERSRGTLQADIERAQADSSRAQTDASVASATAAPRISTAQSQAGTAAAQMSEAQLSTMRSHVANITQQLETLRQDPEISRKKVVMSAVEAALNANAPSGAIAQALQGMPDQDDPDVLRKFLTQSLVRIQGATAHLGATNPAPAFVNTGQQAVPVAAGNQALTGIAPGTPQGVPVQMQVPPTASTMGPGGQPGYLGPQAPQQPGAASIPSGPAIGQVEGTVGPVQVASKHYETVVSDAQAAPTRIAALQTIKQEAPAALTGHGGVGDVLRRFTQIFGGDTASANDVMAKNLAVIAGQAGNTDAARALAEMGSPNYHMTKDAIEQTANQLLGIERKKVAAQGFFSGIPTNDPKYSERMTAWNKYADPRLFEYASLPKEQRAAWMKRLSPGVRADLGMKAEALERLGVDFGL